MKDSGRVKVLLTDSYGLLYRIEMLKTVVKVEEKLQTG
jgi:hypothetical protein